MISLLLASFVSGPVRVMGADVGLVLAYEQGEWQETVVARDAAGKFREILKTPTAKGFPFAEGNQSMGALSSPSAGSLLSSAPSF